MTDIHINQREQVFFITVRSCHPFAHIAIYLYLVVHKIMSSEARVRKYHKRYSTYSSGAYSKDSETNLPSLDAF
jgi:hypothetical protein